MGGEVARVREAVRAGGLLAPGPPIVAMLSGGRDSVCLLDVAVALHGAQSLSALHVNYQLREQAEGDERHCRALCEQLGVPLVVARRPRTPGAGEGGQGARGDPASVEASCEGPAGGPAGNLQAWAREVRYREAERLAGENDALIAAAHTASDQVETILYRLAASPGRRALLGMRARSGRLVRPLLGVSREQTTAYCRERGLRWRDDESNDSDRFARARVRHGLVEAMRAVHPAAEGNVLRTAALLREESELLEELVSAELAGAHSIALARLAELPPALARLLVVRLAEAAAGTYVPQAGARVGEILELGERGGRAELHLGGLAAAVIEDGVLRMARLPPRTDAGERAPQRSLPGGGARPQAD